MKKRLPHRALNAMRNCDFLKLALWVLLLTPCGAIAQPSDATTNDVQVIPPAPSERTSPAPISAAARPVVVRGPCDPDYWIVSTRGAKELVDCGQAVNYVVYRFDGPQPARMTTLDETIASLQPGVPVCVMVHGSFVTWESVLTDSAETYRWLREAAPDQPIQIIFYTWDSDDAGLLPHLKVNSLGRRAAMNGFYVADILNRISHDHPVCLIGHSHGTRAVSAALHLSAGGQVEHKFLSAGPQPVRRIRAVLAAAAIDHVWLNPDRRYGLALCPAEAVINLRNPSDFPLQFYALRRPISLPALAITGLTRRDRAKLGDWNAKIIDYDVSNTVGYGHVWMHYYNQPSIAAAIRHYVYFDEQSTAH